MIDGYLAVRELLLPEKQFLHFLTNMVQLLPLSGDIDNLLSGYPIVAKNDPYQQMNYFVNSISATSAETFNTNVFLISH